MDITSLDKSWVKVGSILLLLAAIVLLFVLQPKTPSIISPDSDVVLAEGATIEKRKAGFVLSGKAYFEIAEDSIVRIFSKDAFVIVQQASFQMETKNNDTEVIVKSGQLELVRVKPNVSARLSAGEKGIVSAYRQGVVKQNNHDKGFLDWMED